MWYPWITIQLAALACATASSQPGYSTVNLRIEGITQTIYEGPIYSGPRNITTKSSLGTWPCDGTQLNANPKPGNTCLDALDAASKDKGFPYDAGFDGEFNDFFVTEIDNDSDPSDSSAFGWGLLLNYQVPKYGLGLTLSGCQQEVEPGDDVLWAYIPSCCNGTGSNFLKVTPNSISVKQYSTATVTVTDGRTGVAVEGAKVDNVETAADGKATITFHHLGFQQYKATRVGDVRSNVLNVTVS